MKTSKSYLDLIFFVTIGKKYLEKHQDAENKISASVKNVIDKQIKKHFETYNDELDTLQVSNCAVHETTKVILKDEKGNRQFTIEGELKLKKESKDLINQVVEIHTRIADGIDSLVAELTEEEKEAFSGIVVPLQELTVNN